jgi:signal transduction histidine kinase/GAF domain-containing protein
MGDMLTDVGMNGRAFRTGDAQHVNDLIGDSDEGPTYQKLYSALSIPMTRGRRRLGVFNVEKDEPFSQNDILLAESMAEVIALALDNAELYAQAQRQLAAQTALQEAVSTISSSLELPVVLNRIAEQMCRAGRATSAYICSYEKQTGMSIVLAEYISPAASAAEQESDLGITYFVPKEFPADMTLLERGYLAIRHVDDPDLPPEEQAHMLQYGAQTVLTIPLQIGGETVAYAEIWESRRRRVFTEGEMELCRGIAQHAAVAMENARLFQAMREEHGRFQALMQSDDDGIILVGMGGHILFMNMPGFTFLRLEVASETGPETWIGRPIDDLVALMQSYAAPAAAVMAAESDRIIIGNEAGGEGEVEIPPRMIHWRNLPVVTDGQPIGRLIILRDVTQEHALEKMRDDLTHTMVHDLRGPLTSISLSLEVLQMLEQLPQDTAERRSQAIERAYNSTQKLLELVEAILELSRLESGRLLLNYQPIILADMVATVLDVQLPLSREKEIELVCHVPDSLPPLSADRSLLERVLQNLVDNALKFTPVGGRVCIKVQSDTAEPQTICVAVSDTGRGIPPEMQSNLFQKFSRGMQKERGSGLGLYFCKMVVEAHDGRIWLAHSDERGTSIHFTLPVNSEQ